MARIITYIMLLTGILAIMNLAGIIPTNIFLSILSWDTLSNASASTLAIAAAAVLVAGVAVGGITVGFFGKTVTESSIVALFAAALLTYMSAALISIDASMGTACAVGSDCRWAYLIIKTILFMFIGGLIISMIQWWRGGDL